MNEGRKKFRYILIPALMASWLLLVFAPTAQAFWYNTYVASQNAYDDEWFYSLRANEEGGDVHSDITLASTTEYTDSYDGNTSVWITGSAAGTGSVLNDWIYGTYAYQDCAWRGFPALSGAAYMSCDQFDDDGGYYT